MSDETQPTDNLFTESNEPYVPEVLPPFEYRQVSSILEYRELNDFLSRFGIHCDTYGVWKPITGKFMLTMNSTELRNLADIIDRN